MIVFPNAKINIGLNVVEKRSDGFHNVECIIYPVLDVYDVLEVVENNQLEFTSSGIEIPGDSDANLCLKAFHLLKEAYNIPFVKIYLHKNIPIGAGLGGGSADAAFMLKILNKMFQLNLTTDQLIHFARKLGSDCAFFIENKPVYAFHKGDELEAINLDLSRYEIKIEHPKIHLGTADVYSGITPHAAEKNLKELIEMPLNKWKGLIKNDFEASVFPQYPKVKKLKEEMYVSGATYASMTGTGSAVYGVFELK